MLWYGARDRVLGSKCHGEDCELHSEAARFLLEILRNYAEAQRVDDMLACDRIDRIRYGSTANWLALSGILSAVFLMLLGIRVR